MPNDLSDLYQEVILDHSKCPRNFQRMECANRVAEGRNPLCGDQVTVFLNMDHDVIKDISFQGHGCAISKAAASIMTASLKGKTRIEAKKMFDDYHHLITTGTANEGTAAKLAVFAGVHKYPSRVKCAILPWHAVVAALEDKKQPVSTE